MKTGGQLYLEHLFPVALKDVQALAQVAPVVQRHLQGQEEGSGAGHACRQHLQVAASDGSGRDAPEPARHAPRRCQGTADGQAP